MSTVQFVDPLPEQQKIHAPASIKSRPRPILKSLPMPDLSPLPFSTYPLDSPHVHFPPTPTLTSTTFTHSAIVYDRAPIVVAENVCALPERGGRCYTPRLKTKQSSMRHCHPNVGVGRVSADRCAFDPSEPKGSYFHPRAFEVCQPEPTCAVERYTRYDSYLLDSSSSSSSSEHSSSSSSESDSDSDSSYDSFSPTSSIPCVAVDAFILGGSLSTYPPDPSLIQQSQNVTSQQRFARLSILRQPQQQLSHTVHYARSPSPDLAESKPKKAATMSGRKTKSSQRSGTATSRLAKFGGGFSDQSMLLEGCLGGF